MHPYSGRPSEQHTAVDAVTQLSSEPQSAVDAAVQHCSEASSDQRLAAVVSGAVHEQ